MITVGQTIVYRRGVCKVTELIKDFRNGEDYYTLIPLNDATLVIHAPALSAQGMSRPVISKEEVEQLIDRMPEIEEISTTERTLESSYKELFNSGKHEDLIRIIKTTYLRSEDKASKGQKRGEKDKIYIRMAENALYNELAVALGKTYADTKEYVVERVAILADNAAKV